MDIKTITEYLYANGLPVRDTQEPTSQQPGTVIVDDSIAIFVQSDSAQVVQIESGGAVKSLPSVTTYIGIVAGVKSFRPARGTMAPGPMAW